MGKILPGIFCAFENPKGGAGKSTLTAIFAGYLHSVGKEQGLEIGVIDIDDIQNSVNKLRQLEETEETSGEYRIMSISSSDVIDQMDFLKEEFDIILIDFPGNLKQEGVIEILHLIDVCIIPFEPNQISLMATLDFYELYTGIIAERSKNGLKTIVKGVPNRVVPNLTEYKSLIAEKDSLPFELLDNHIKESKVEFQRNITTLMNEYRNNADAFCEEVLELLTSYITE